MSHGRRNKNRWDREIDWVVLALSLLFFMTLFPPGWWHLGAEARAASGPGAIDLVILADRSASMNEAGGDPQGLTRAAVEYLLDQLELAGDDNRAAVVPFSTRVSVIPEEGLTPDFDAKIRPRLDILGRVRGFTDMEDALQQGLRILASAKGRRQMVLITDGKPEPGFQSPRVADRFPRQLQLSRKRISQQRRRSLLNEMSRLSVERIRKLLFGVLRENHIELYPVAFSGIEKEGEELLAAMASQVTRDQRAFKKISARDLIVALDSIVPKPQTVMNIRRAALDRAGIHHWSVTFDLDSSLEKVRVLILYRSPRGDINWQLQGPKATLSPKDPGAARYCAARDRNGSGRIIFERLFLDRPASGPYQLNFEAKGFLPRIQVIVEGRTDLQLEIQADPEPGETEVPMSIYCRVGGSRSVPLFGAKGWITDERGASVGSPIVFQKNGAQQVKGLWVPERPGRYRLKLVAYLDAEGHRYLTARYLLRVQPRQAVDLAVVVPVVTGPSGGTSPHSSQRGPSLDNLGKHLEFQTLTANRRGYTIEGIRIENKSARKVQAVLSIEGLRHQATNFALDPEAWCRPSPTQGYVGRDRPLKVNLAVRIPKRIPAGLPDGLYVGRLLVQSPDAREPVSIPIRFTLDLPDFLAQPAAIVDSGLDIPMYCCLPDVRTTGFELSTDALEDQKVFLVAPLTLVSDETGQSLSSRQAVITLGPDGTSELETVIHRQGHGPDRIRVQAQVMAARLSPGRYTGDIALRSELGRTLHIPVNLVVPERFWTAQIRVAAAAAALFLMLVTLAGPVRTWIRRRRQCYGGFVTIRRQAANRVTTPSPWDRLLDVTWQASDRSWRITSRRATLEPDRPSAGAVPNTVRIPQGEVISFRLRHGRENYRLTTATAGSHRLRLRILQSPHRRGRILAGLFLGLALAGISAGVALRPEWLCRFLP